MESNAISVPPYKHQVLIGDTFVIYTRMDILSQYNVTSKAHVLRTVAPTTIWPGDYLEVDVPKSVLYRDVKLVVELHLSGSFGVLRYYTV